MDPLSVAICLMAAFVPPTCTASTISLDDIAWYLGTYQTLDGNTSCLTTCLTKEKVLPAKLDADATRKTDGNNDVVKSGKIEITEATPKAPQIVMATHYYQNYYVYQMNPQFFYATVPTVVPPAKPTLSQYPALALALRYCERACRVVEEKGVEKLFEFLLEVLPGLAARYLTVHHG